MSIYQFLRLGGRDVVGVDTTLATVLDVAIGILSVRERERERKFHAENIVVVDIDSISNVISAATDTFGKRTRYPGDLVDQQSVSRP